MFDVNKNCSIFPNSLLACDKIRLMGKFLLLFFISISMGVFAQKADTAKVVKDTTKAPVIAFETTVLSYGTIEQGSDPMRIIKFKNTGNAPLKISHCASPCPCLIASSSTEPILPGESGEIRLKYDTGKVGTFNKTVTVYSNSKKTVVLSVKGIVVAKKPTTKDKKKK